MNHIQCLLSLYGHQFKYLQHSISATQQNCFDYPKYIAYLVHFLQPGQYCNQIMLVFTDQKNNHCTQTHLVALLSTSAAFSPA